MGVGDKEPISRGYKDQCESGQRQSQGLGPKLCKGRVELIQRHACVHLPLPLAVVLPPDCPAAIDGSLEL